MSRMERVKYSRREYREDYLKSDEWKKLRRLILDVASHCEKCKNKKAQDVHHTQYRQIVDVRVTDLVALCRVCHDLVHKAIRLKMLRPRHRREDVLSLDFDRVKEKMKFLGRKTKIDWDLCHRLNKLSPDGKKAACGVLKVSPPFDFMEWINIKVSNRQMNGLVAVINRFGSKVSLQDSHRQKRKKRKQFKV